MGSCQPCSCPLANPPSSLSPTSLPPSRQPPFQPSLPPACLQPLNSPLTSQSHPKAMPLASPPPGPPPSRSGQGSGRRGIDKRGGFRARRCEGHFRAANLCGSWAGPRQGTPSCPGCQRSRLCHLPALALGARAFDRFDGHFELRGTQVLHSLHKVALHSNVVLLSRPSFHHRSPGRE